MDPVVDKAYMLKFGDAKGALANKDELMLTISMSPLDVVVVLSCLRPVASIDLRASNNSLQLEFRVL